MKATVAKVNVNASNWVTAKCHARVILLRGTGGTALVLTGHERQQSKAFVKQSMVVLGCYSEP